MSKNLFCIIYSILFFLNIDSVKNDYVTFDLNTYKNNSNYPEENVNFYYNNLNNMLYSKISLGTNKENYIMELKDNTFGFSIFNHNCDIPPVDNSKSSSYLPTLANSSIIDYVDDNYTTSLGEYFPYILNNTLNVQTNKGEKNVEIDFIFSLRNDTNYIKKVVLRPYTCFTLGFILTFLSPDEQIDKVDDFGLNLIFQFKKKKIISTYNWFIEYDTNNKEQGKLVLGVKPHEYDPIKYKENNMKILNAVKRKDNTIRWDINVDEVYFKNDSNSKDEIKFYPTCSLEPSLGVIFAPSGYKLKIEQFIIKPLMNENKCFKSIIFNRYIFYYCNKDTKEIIKNNKYSTIYFMHRFFGKTFELNFDDLYTEQGNYIYLKLFFDEKDNEIWRFGKPFLSKYFFSYDLDGRTISFYDDKDDSSEKKSNVLLILIIIILIIIFAVLGFFLGRHIYSIKKKKTGTELIESDNYGDININETS